MLTVAGFEVGGVDLAGLVATVDHLFRGAVLRVRGPVTPEHGRRVHNGQLRVPRSLAHATRCQVEGVGVTLSHTNVNEVVWRHIPSLKVEWYHVKYQD